MRATAWLQSCCCLILVSRSLASLRQHVHFKGDLAAWSAAGQTLTDLWSGCSRGQRYRFVRYEPSAWEAEVSSEEPCQQVAAAAPKVSSWLSGVQDFSGLVDGEDASNSRVPAARNETFLSHFDEAIFSRMIYRNVCPGGGGRSVAVPIEPLIAHLRHPFGICGDNPQVDIQDKSYMLINAWPASLLLAKYPGRKYLFDMGASTFDTSLTYFTKRYEQAGVLFDEVWAWEMAAYQPTDYWAKVPDHYKGRMHFYNTAYVANKTSASHPLNIMRGIYKSGDMIVVKLDIDNAPLEISIIEDIENDPALVDMIAEMYFEMHYDHVDIVGAFGYGNGHTVNDVQTRFAALRKLGLHIHYWP